MLLPSCHLSRLSPVVKISHLLGIVPDHLIRYKSSRPSTITVQAPMYNVEKGYWSWLESAYSSCSGSILGCLNWHADENYLCRLEASVNCGVHMGMLQAVFCGGSPVLAALDVMGLQPVMSASIPSPLEVRLSALKRDCCHLLLIWLTSRA